MSYFQIKKMGIEEFHWLLGDHDDGEDSWSIFSIYFDVWILFIYVINDSKNWIMCIFNEANLKLVRNMYSTRDANPQQLWSVVYGVKKCIICSRNTGTAYSCEDEKINTYWKTVLYLVLIEHIIQVRKMRYDWCI